MHIRSWSSYLFWVWRSTDPELLRLMKFCLVWHLESGCKQKESSAAYVLQFSWRCRHFVSLPGFLQPFFDIGTWFWLMVSGDLFIFIATRRRSAQIWHFNFKDFSQLFHVFHNFSIFATFLFEQILWAFAPFALLLFEKNQNTKQKLMNKFYHHFLWRCSESGESCIRLLKIHVRLCT